MAFRGQDQFRTDPTGVLARGAPSGGGGGGLPIGGISPSQIPPAVQPGGSQAPGPRAPGGVGISFGTSFGGGDVGSLTRGTGPTKKKAAGGKVDMAQDKAMIRKAIREHDAQKHKGSKPTKLKLAKGGSTASKRADGCATKGKTKGRFV